MSEELQSLVQIIELYGKGLGGLGKALRFSAKGAAKGVQIAYNPENVENVRMVIDY
jgi:putative lipoic acid-binding regulatory protein